MARTSGPASGSDAANSPRALQRLHEAHAGRLRTAARWLGFTDETREEAVRECFAALGEAVPEDRAVGWALLMRTLARKRAPSAAPVPGSRAEAALLGFLFRRCSAQERAVFALAELGGFDATQLARAIGAPPEAGQALIVGLRRSFAGDPAVGAAGGPAAVLRRCVAEDEAPEGWQAQSLAGLLGEEEPEIPRAALVGIGGLALAVLLTLRAEPEVEAEAEAVERVSEVIPTPVPVPVIAAPPAVQTDGPEENKGQAVVVRKKRPAGAAQGQKKAALAKRAETAAGRDPGAVIVELEMLGAARKALKTHPGQALAYVEQHRREYPNSQLVDHSAEVRVRALCALGRTAEARAEAQRRPTGKVQAALRESCKR